MSVKATKEKIALMVYVTPETYEEIDRNRGTLKKSTYTAMVLEEIFNPEKAVKLCLFDDLEAEDKHMMETPARKIFGSGPEEDNDTYRRLKE
ncbi:hypothetical protein [Methanosarcina sp.]|mgnify:CR=1 FL=1|uniref:hypothetical protein n=1 Tax=Methanosarcina sp. TaxID=2213 RepID=UPI002B984A74|nr:hypothetical protein [Methanosarcina sp.]HOW15050.1 hypothetical protein [Methanosarcina sp.]